MFNVREYRIPKNPYIGRGDDTERLYYLEEKRDMAISAEASVLGELLGLKEKYKEIMPEVLLSILESYDITASQLAAWAYLQKHPLTEEELEYVKHATV